MNEEDELFKKCFIKTLKKLAEEPDEVINYNEQLKKYNNLLKEKIKLQQELQRKDNVINELKESINNFDVFKEFTFPLMKRDEEQQVISSIDYEWRKSIKEPFLDKIKELEGKDE